MDTENNQDGFEVVQWDAVPVPQSQPEASLEKRMASLRRWLQPTAYLSPGNELMKHWHSYAAGTGQWSRNSALFQAWSNPDSVDAACLHVRGVAGSGKSVFAAATIRKLQDAGHTVLFFFFRHIVDKNHAAKYLVRDFAAQLLPHCPSLVTGLAATSQEHGVDGNEMDLVWPALAKALSTQGSVNETGHTTGPVYCVVDALDEMDDEDFDAMVQKLVALGTAAPEKVKIMMTSRPLPKIDKALAAPSIMHLKLDPAMLSPDVARYVTARMASLERPLSEDKNRLVRDTICERASGLFLHARLAVDNLAEGLQDGRITEEALPSSLERIPSSLRQVYEDMLQEHACRSSVTAEQQAKILMCVTHASRPLRLIELGSLVSRLMSLDLRRGKDLVRAACGRLLEIMEDESVSVIHHSFTEFLHDEGRRGNIGAFPVLQDIASHAMLAMLSLEYLDSCPPLDSMIEDEGEEAVDKNTAILYRQEKGKKHLRTEIKTNNPLVSYVADNLVFHLSRAAEGNTKELLKAIDTYFVARKPAFQNWLFFVWPGQSYGSVNLLHLGTGLWEGTAMPLFVMRHFAAQHPQLIDAPDVAGRTPLYYAAKRGYDEKVDFLLANGADAGRAGRDGLTPMHVAAASGSAGVVRKFLDMGIDPLIKTAPVMREYDPYEGDWIDYTEEEAEDQRRTALSHAFSGDDPEVIAAFLPFIPPSELNIFFHRTTKVETVRALLDTGRVDIDCYLGGTTKLFDAMRQPHLDIVKLLLERGADPTKRSCRDSVYRDRSDTVTFKIDKIDSERGPTPLHALTDPTTRGVQMIESREEVRECIRIMVTAGADINATTDAVYGAGNLTPLHLAVQRADSMGMSWGSLDKSEEILTEELLAAGADPAAQNGNGDTPIHVANVEKPRLFELLMKHGGEKARNASGRPPLHEMLNRLAHPDRFSLESVKPNADIFKKLSDYGKNADVVDNGGNNIFHHIMHSMTSLSRMPDTSFIAKLLAGAGPDDLNRRNNKGQEPLWRYKLCDSSWRSLDDDDEDILRMMAHAGLNLNSRNDKGQTILWHIAGFEEGLNAIQKFVRLGVEPQVMDSNGETLLHAVVRLRRPPEWVSYLTSIGVAAKHTSSTTDGNTLIHEVLHNKEDYAANYAWTVMQWLVQAGVDPLAMNNKGQTALHVVQTQWHLNLVMQSHYFDDLDINQQDHDGFTPLHHAVSLGEETAIHSLIRRGADPTLVASDGSLPLHVAARDGDAGTLGLLLAQYRERGILESFVNSVGAGRTPLHFACQTGKVENVLLLLQHGANPSIVDDDGLTPLHAVAEIKSPSSARVYHCIVRLLRKAGADLSPTAKQAADEPKNGAINAGQTTPLDMAVGNETWDMVRALLSHGVEPSSSHLQSPQFVLATDKTKAAEEAERAQCVQAGNLKDRDASRGIRRRRGGASWRGRWASSRRKQKANEDNDDEDFIVTGGQTILNALSRKQVGEADQEEQLSTEDMMEIAYNALEDLLQQGDIDSIDEYAALGGDLISPRSSRYEDTFFHCLVREGYFDLLEHFGDKTVEMMQSGRDRIQRYSNDGHDGGTRTLLATACERNTPSLHIIELLVDKFGADVNAASLENSRPLHILAAGRYFWQIEALEYLVSKGADVHSRNEKGFTPLLVAVSRQASNGPWCEATARILLQHGADPNARVKLLGQAVDTGDHHLSAIEMSRQAEVTKLLLEHGANLDGCPGLLQRTIKETMDPDNVKCLLLAGVDPNERPQVGHDTNGEDSLADDAKVMRYALHEAARPSTKPYPDRHFDSRQEATIQALLLHGANPSAPYPDGSFVLQRIIEDRGRFDCLVPCLAQIDLNSKGFHGRTMLASACAPMSPVGPPQLYHSDQPICKTPTVMEDAIFALLNTGKVNALVTDNQGRTPLHLLCTFAGPATEEFNKALIALIDRQPEAICVKDTDGRTPLHLALHTFSTQRSQTSTSPIRHLINSGADVARSDPLNNNSALHYIATRLGGEACSAAEATALFRELVVDSALDVDARNAAGETPCFSLCATSWDGTHDPKGRKPHPYYAKAHDVSHAKAHDVSHAKAHDVSHAKAHDVSHAKALDVFVELGANLTTADSKGRNLLHVTAARQLSDGSSDWHEGDDLTETFKKLMDLGVDPRKEDDELRTAIDIAVARDLLDVVNLFSKKEDEDEDLEEDGSEDDT